MTIKRLYPSCGSCHSCGQADNTWVYGWFVDDDVRRKALARICACSESHAAVYFERYKSFILNGKENNERQSHSNKPSAKT